MYFDYRIVGVKPTGGRSLYISMHGGGEGPAAMNDQQWQNQIRLYNIKEGIYLAPRAIDNTWNMWQKPMVDYFFEQIIKHAITMEAVDPNKIYLLGYSAGGDGVYQLGPRMADFWAAAAMMAGHPGDARAENLMNLPFSISVGALDSSFNRNALAAIWKLKLDSLQKFHPGNYAHRVNIYDGLPHWMNRKDSTEVAWMATQVRNPAPAQITWIQDDVPKTRFYYLGTAISKASPGKRVDIRRSQNRIDVGNNDYDLLYIYLNDQVVNMDKPVKVYLKGKLMFSGLIARNPQMISKTATEYLDKSRIYYARLVLTKDRAYIDNGI
jgi:hypothetical protein